jgi:aldose 1-epimerase
MTRFFLLASLFMLMTSGINVWAADSIVFNSSMTKDSETGWNIVTLTAENKTDPHKSISVKITPEGGDNLYSFTIGGTELLRGPEKLSQLSKQFFGTPILFPTPNRVRNGIYVFLGDTLKQSLPGETRLRTIHGLVWDDPNWKFEPPVTGKNSASFKAWYVFDRNNPRLEGYPFPNTLTVEYTLFNDRVRISYDVVNQGVKPLGFGFALHPFWNVIGSKDDVTIKVPLPYHMDATNMLPSGKLDKVTGDSKWSLLEPKPLSSLRLDDVYFGSTPKREVVAMFKSIGLELRQRATADFTHVVIYTPDTNYFCLENQTSSTDAHNLYSKGLVKESHLQILKPGQKTGGEVEYIVGWKR